MKWIQLTVAMFVTSDLLTGQQSKPNNGVEQQIRALELSDVDAVLRNDMTAVDKLWAEDLIVNAPNNKLVQGKQAVVELKKSGMKYSSFVRDIESIVIHGDTVIVMGRETVVPVGDSADAGKTIHRRFTNVWMKRAGTWRLTARQANVICQN